MGVDKPAKRRCRLIGELMDSAAVRGAENCADPAFGEASGYFEALWAGDADGDEIGGFTLLTELADDFAGGGACAVTRQGEGEGIFAGKWR